MYNGGSRLIAIQEVHIIHPFQNDFYAHDMTVLVLGYVRPELDYVSKGKYNSRIYGVSDCG